MQHSFSSHASSRSNSPPPSPSTTTAYLRGPRNSDPPPTKSHSKRALSFDVDTRIARPPSDGLGERSKEEQKRLEKVDHIVQHIFSKTTQILSQARFTRPDETRQGASSKRQGSIKTEKWFNLELEDYDPLKPQLHPWRNISVYLLSSPPIPVPPLIVEVVLQAVNLSPNQVVVLSDDLGNRSKAEDCRYSSSGGVHGPRKSAIVVESWRMDMIPRGFSPGSISPSELPTLYKKCIAHFRTLYSMIRTLPAGVLHRKWTRRRLQNAGFKLECRLKSATQEERIHELGLDAPVTAHEAVEGSTETYAFSSIVTPFGDLQLQCTYRLNADFCIEDNEALLSLRFIDEEFFKPTAAGKARPQPGSLPIRPAAPSPNRNMSPARGAFHGSLPSRHAGGQSPDSESIPDLPRRLRTTSEAITPSGSMSSGSGQRRIGSYGADVEPAFVSRPRTTSFNPSSSQSSGMGSFPSRKHSFNAGKPAVSPSNSSSPIFRAGSNINSPAGSSGSGWNPPKTFASPSGPLFPQPGRSVVSPFVLGTSPSTQPQLQHGKSSSARLSRGHESSASAGSGPDSLGRFGSSPGLDSVGTGAGSSESSTTTPSSVPPTDADDVNRFLELIDSRPQLRSTAVRHSVTLSRAQVDDTMRRLAGSVMGVPESAFPRRSRLRDTSEETASPEDAKSEGYPGAPGYDEYLGTLEDLGD